MVCVRRRDNRNDGKASGRFETQECQTQTNGYGKREKESEPCIDEGGLKDENIEINPEERSTEAKNGCEKQ